MNEMVSLGDTVISLQNTPTPTFGEGVFLITQNSKCQVLAKFQILSGGGGIPDYSKRKVQSAKSWPNFNSWLFNSWLLENRVFLAKWTKNSESLPKFW